MMMGVLIRVLFAPWTEMCFMDEGCYLKGNPPGQTVVDTGSGTFATGMACMVQPRQCHFLGWEIDITCFNESLVEVEEVFVRHFFNASNIVSEADVQPAAIPLEYGTDGICANWEKDCGCPWRFCLSQSSTIVITSFQFNHFENMYLYEMVKSIPFSQWSEKQRGWLYTMDVDTLLSLHCKRLGLFTKKSKVLNCQAGNGAFPHASRPFGQAMKVAYYFDILLYALLCCRKTPCWNMANGFWRLQGRSPSSGRSPRLESLEWGWSWRRDIDSSCPVVYYAIHLL